LPGEFQAACVCLPGVLAVTGPKFLARPATDSAIKMFCESIPTDHPINQFPLVVICDDSQFTAQTLNNFLWTVFTRSNPASDIAGIGASTVDKHWGCRGSLVIDARIKPHHAPPLIEDPEIMKRVDARAARGGPLAKYL
jgi:4-hydroxy-3-polyprenylbenzoate decarboxylase